MLDRTFEKYTFDPWQSNNDNKKKKELKLKAKSNVVLGHLYNTAIIPRTIVHTQRGVMLRLNVSKTLDFHKTVLLGMHHQHASVSLQYNYNYNLLV